MSVAPSDRKLCPHCHAVARPKADECWLCGAIVQPNWPTAAQALAGGGPFMPQRRPRPAGGPHAPFQFGLSTLMLIVTLAAVLFSMIQMAPGIGIPAAVLTVAGLLGVVRKSFKVEGRPLTWEEKLGAFARTAGITALVFIGIAAVLAIAGAIFLLIVCSGGRGGFR